MSLILKQSWQGLEGMMTIEGDRQALLSLAKNILDQCVAEEPFGGTGHTFFDADDRLDNDYDPLRWIAVKRVKRVKGDSE